MPTGDPGIKPVELLSWAKDFKTSSVPFRIPGFSSPDSNKNPTLQFNASNPVNCSGKKFDEIKQNVKENMNKKMDSSLLDKYAYNFYYNNKKTKDILQRKYGSYEAFVDNIYTIIYRESKGNPALSNTRNSNGTWDCGLMQINTKYAGFDFEVLLKNSYNALYENLKKAYPKETGVLIEAYEIYKKNPELLKTNTIIKNNICEALKPPEINLAIALSLLTANIQNYDTIIKGNLAYGGDRLVQNQGFMSDDANCIFIKYLQKYPQYYNSKEFKYKI
jgi:hypothetical protein